MRFLTLRVASGPEEDEGVGVRKAHVSFLISRIYPNGRRIRRAWPRAACPGAPKPMDFFMGHNSYC
jgi:hypothetical protein